MKTRLICFTALLATLFACSDDQKDSAKTQGDKALHFRSTIDAPSNETVYMWIDEVQADVAKSYLNAWSLTTSGGIGLKETTTKYFPKSGNQLNAYAMHGNFAANAIEAETTPFPTSSIVHSVKDAQIEVSDYSVSDLFYSSSQGIKASQSETTLSFYHLLTRVEIAMMAGTDLTVSDLKDATVRIVNTKLKADFSPKKLSKEQIKEKSARNEMLKPSATDNEAKPIAITAIVAPDEIKNLVSVEHAKAFVIPQTVNGNFIEVKFADKTMYYSVENMKLEGGTRYIFNVTVNSDQLDVDVEAIDLETGEFVMPKIGEIRDPKLSKVGDFIMSDGSFVGKDVTLTQEQVEACVGIVFWKNNPSIDDPALRREHPQCNNGLIIALKNTGGAKPWQLPKFGFVGKDWIAKNTKGLIHITSMYGPKENLHKILGYNNTLGISLYNELSGLAPVIHAQEVDKYAKTVPAPKNSSGWYLPSAKELAILRTGADIQDIYFSDNMPAPSSSNSDLVDAQITKLPVGKAEVLKKFFYGTSTEHGCGVSSFYSVEFVYREIPKPWYVGEGKKNMPMFVRAVCAF